MCGSLIQFYRVTLVYSCLVVLVYTAGAELLQAENRPNILLIFADDLGWSDLSCYGSSLFSTPNLDRLADSGMQFEQAYAAAPICSASRAALLTGNSTARNKFEFVVKKEPGAQQMPTPLQSPPFTLDLDLDARTMAEALSEGGYRTAFFGKWHLNAHYEGYLGWSPTHGPRAQGFQVAVEDFGSHPYSYWRKGKQARNYLDLQQGQFPEDGVTNRAIRYLEESRDEPFFLMVSHFYVHDPNHTRIRWLKEKYLQELPENLAGRDAIASYGSMVTTLDHYVGRLLEALRHSGKADNTLVVFTSDNGGHPEYAGNAPLRGSKWNLYEGGIRVPFLARWPGVIAAGSRSKVPVWSPDLFTTFAELAGVEVSASPDGRSILPVLRGETETWEERPMIWHFPYYHPETRYSEKNARIGVNDGFTSKTKPHSALRLGNWKLMHFYEDGRDELYHLAEDTDESNDRSAEFPERVQQLRVQLFNYLEAVDARFPTQASKDPK